MRRKKNIVLIMVLLATVGILTYILYGVTQRNANYFISLRGTKIIAIILVSYCIGYSSTVFQTITESRILTPSIMGLESLYLFIQTIIVFFLQPKGIVGLNGNLNLIISIVAMIGVSSILYIILFKGEKKNIYFLLLTGIVLGSLFDGLSNFMQVLLDPNEFLVLQGKMFASFSSVNESFLGIAAVICIICFLYSFRDFKELDVVSLGVSQSINLGVNYKKLVMKNLIIISVLVSVSTVLVGPITFLGIILISLARQIVKTYKHSYLVFASTFIGIILLVYGLFLIEKVLELETTISVIINFFGGIYFIFFTLREGKR